MSSVENPPMAPCCVRTGLPDGRPLPSLASQLLPPYARHSLCLECPSPRLPPRPSQHPTRSLSQCHVLSQARSDHPTEYHGRARTPSAHSALLFSKALLTSQWSIKTHSVDLLMGSFPHGGSKFHEERNLYLVILIAIVQNLIC